MSTRKFRTASAPPTKPPQPADYLTPPGHPIGCKCIHCVVDHQDLTEKISNSLKNPPRRGIGRNRYGVGRNRSRNRNR